MVIEACSSRETEALHQSEAGAIDEREVLIVKNVADDPRRLEIHSSHLFDFGGAVADAEPESLRGIAVHSTVQEEPCFDKHVIRHNRSGDLGKNRFCADSAGPEYSLLQTKP